MKKKILSVVIVLCIVMSLLPTVSISAETTSYTTGLFAAKFSQNQIFDIIGDSGLNGLSFDSSWGFAGNPSGHQFKTEHLANRYFVFKYSGDSIYPFALFLYNNDNTPVVSNKDVDTSDNLYNNSLIGCNENGCLTENGKAYMTSTYGGISGLVAQGIVEKMDENGFLFRSKNGFGYYISGNRGYNGSEIIVWINPKQPVSLDDLANITTYTDVPLTNEQYAVMFNANTTDSVTNLPTTQTKTKDTELLLSSNIPLRSDYKFKCWNTKADGTGTSYNVGTSYTANTSLTLYAIWEQELDFYTVSGTIKGSDTNSGIAATVQLKKDGNNIGPAVTANADGTYTIPDVTEGTYTIEVSCDGYDEGTINSFTVSDTNVTNKDLTLTKTVTTYIISATAGTGGSISPSGSVTVNSGASQVFTITPNTNYSIADVKLDNVSVGKFASCGFSDVTANHTISATFSYNGGSSSSNSGSSSTFTYPTQSTVDEPSASIQEEVKVNGKANGTIDSNGNANVNITDERINDAYSKALDHAKRNGKDDKGLSIILNTQISNKAVNSVTVNLPQTVQDTIMSKNIANTVMVVVNPDIEINIDLSTVKEISKQANTDVNITAKKIDNSTLSTEVKKVVGNRPVFDFTIEGINGKKVTKFGNGNISVSIPYTLSANEKAENIVVYYIDDNGKIQEMPNCIYDEKTKTISFTTNHFSKFGVGYKQAKATTQKTSVPKTGDMNSENIKTVVYLLMCGAIMFSLAKRKLTDK